MDYSLEVRQRFHLLEGAGEHTEGTPGLVVGEAEDRTLNVWIRIQVSLVESIIRSVRYQVFGCPHMVAAAGWVAEALQGQSRDVLLELDMNEIRNTLDAPLEKLGKLLVLEDALHTCWRDSNVDPIKQNGI